MNPLQTQVGGGHYKKQAIQPIEFSMANGLDACAHSTLKYVGRHPEKGGRQDLEKAFHFVQLREALGTAAHRVNEWVVDIMAYCQANAIPSEEAGVLCDLCSWVESGDPLKLRRLKNSLLELIELRYPE